MQKVYFLLKQRKKDLIFVDNFQVVSPSGEQQSEKSCLIILVSHPPVYTAFIHKKSIFGGKHETIKKQLIVKNTYLFSDEN